MGNVPGSSAHERESLAQAKIDDKMAADQRGHGLGVSLEVYLISDLEQKIEAVKRLESEVIQ